MQIIRWLLKVADEPPCGQTNKASCSAKPKEVVSKHLRPNQRQKRASISLGCENFTLFTLLRRRDIAKTFFYNTLDRKRVHTMKMMMKKEDTARGLDISNNKGLDLVANCVSNTMVLPLTDAELSFRQQCGNDPKRNHKAKSDKTKTLSKLKELLRWATAAKTEKAGKYFSRKVFQFRNGETLCNDSPKISFRWDMESFSTTSSVYSALSKASSKKFQNMNIHLSMNSTPVHERKQLTSTKSGNWITTDSDFVVLEL